MNVKTRFPPSPTGFLHIGGLRTALYNYLFAKQNNGIFLLRIEDTDRERYVEGAVEALIKTLAAVGLSPDEGPYIQSERLAIYKEHVEKLLKNDFAYRCFCTKERLTQLRAEQQSLKLQTKYDRHCLALSETEVLEHLRNNTPFVVRMKIPDGVTTFTDEIRGTISINNSELDDQVILKSDGYPTYHLAVVVDDHLMGVTHIIRGEEWISSVPKHIILYQAFGFNLPVFAHLPLILNEDKSKLSKRQGDVAVEQYIEQGYLPSALINFVALLGFNPRADRELYSMDELIEFFDLKKINKSGAVFNREKLDWMNGQYIQKKSGSELARLMGKSGDVFAERVFEVEKTRVRRLNELDDLLHTYKSVQEYEAELLIWRKSNKKETLSAIENLLEFINSLDDNKFNSVELLESVLKEYIGSRELDMGTVLWPLRVGLSGLEKSPSPFELLWIFGKHTSIQRLNNAIKILS